MSWATRIMWLHRRRWHVVLSFWVPKPAQVSHCCTRLVSCEASLPLIHVVLTVVLTVAYNLNNGLKKSFNFYPLKPPAFVPLVQAVEFVAMDSTAYLCSSLSPLWVAWMFLLCLSWADPWASALAAASEKTIYIFVNFFQKVYVLTLQRTICGVGN